MNQKSNRDKTISLRLTPMERAAIEKIAARQGRTISDWIRWVANQAAKDGK
jgi:uncharacterized protein (DUF1778 family)